MKIVWQSGLFLLTLLAAAAEAKPIVPRDSTPLADVVTPTRLVQTIQNYMPEVLVLVELVKKDDGSQTNQKEWAKPHVLWVVQQDDGPAENGKDLATSDPNILLMVENFQSNQQWSESSVAPRLARDMSRDAEPAEPSDPEYMETGTSRGNYYDVYIMPRRSRAPEPRPPHTSLLPPPSYMHTATPRHYNAAEYNGQSNRVSGRSINSPIASPNQHNDDDDPPDFLSTLVTLPQVWMHDLSHMIIQPLRKPSSGERDSFEYFGMVGKAPFIQCPLGFKKSSLGNKLQFIFDLKLHVHYKRIGNCHSPLNQKRNMSSGIPESQELSNEQRSGARQFRDRVNHHHDDDDYRGDNDDR